MERTPELATPAAETLLRIQIGGGRAIVISVESGIDRDDDGCCCCYCRKVPQHGTPDPERAERWRRAREAEEAAADSA
jgi:hypothetical protein